MRFSPAKEKRVGDQVKLRALWWEGPLPEPGDMLVTSTGRRYLIDRTTAQLARGGHFSFTIVVIVVPSSTSPLGRTFKWTWTRKGLRRPRGWRAG